MLQSVDVVKVLCVITFMESDYYAHFFPPCVRNRWCRFFRFAKVQHFCQYSIIFCPKSKIPLFVVSSLSAEFPLKNGYK